MAGRIVAVALVVAGLLVAVPVAGAVTLPPTGNPLPGSKFQGADGDQVPTSSTTDWATLPAGTVDHVSDDNVNDTAFKGGSKEDNPAGWDLVTEPGGVDPAKANIRDAWSSVNAVGAGTFVYLAFARQESGGSAFLTFELNRDGRPWDNGRALIPCRRDGDLLITFEPQAGTVAVTVKTWQTAQADPATGCARTGSLSDAANVTANVDVQGAMNAGSIANSLGGAFGGTIPAEQFGETAINLGRVLSDALGTTCGAFTSFWMHSRSSPSEDSNMQDYVAPHAIDARRCSAAGTKWLDNNANGVRDGGDVPLAGFRIYADLNNNFRFDADEPFAITDATGDYVIDDLPATGTYTLREQPTSAVPIRGPWLCSFPSPCRYRVDAAAEPYARNLDFGNWRPARLTLKKQLVPASDPGRFNLSAGSPRLTLFRAGNGASRTFLVRPGTYTVTETPSRGTNAADYTSFVSCHRVTQTARLLRATGPTTVTLAGGDEFECRFVNVRNGSLAVTLDKALVAPENPVHGDTLRYRLVVTNTGKVKFAAGNVHVTDSLCDNAPRLIRKFGPTGTTADATPDTLDPGDRWVYGCRHATEPVNPDACQPTTITNTGHVSVPGTGGEDSTNTDLGCPTPPQPRIAIDKVGPTTAVAGTPLTYVFNVTNTGDVPFTEDNVTVSDPACDPPGPQRVGRFQRSGSPDTSTPDVLNPGDTWVYTCVNTTPAPGPDCQPSVLSNTATVAGESSRPPVHDSDEFDTALTCPPPGPIPPEPTPQPQPEPPSPGNAESGAPAEAPSVSPPRAGLAGLSRLSPVLGCLRRGSRVVIGGNRIASITLTVGGRRIGGVRVQALQERAVVRLVSNPRPGRYRVTATIRFQRGSSTPTVRLTRTVRVCAAAAQPNFTG